MKDKLDMTCPKCSEPFNVSLRSVWEEHSITVAYKLKEGHRMGVEEFAESIKALAKLMKLSAKELGIKVQVVICGLEVTESEVSATVAVVEMVKG